MRKPSSKYIIITIAAVLPILASALLFRYAKDQQALLNLLPNLITATSIIVAILIGYLFIRFVGIRQTRYEKLNRFIELQEELQPYREAFYNLALLLAGRYKIEPQWQRGYFDLCKDDKFLEDANQKPSGTLFVRALERVGKHHRLIAPEELDSINECLMSLSETLCREKHYKHVFSDLGIPLDSNFRK